MGASRIANVTAAMLVGFGSAPPAPSTRSSASLVELVEALFEDTLWVGDPGPAAARGRHAPITSAHRSPLVGLAAALEAAEGERVIVFATDDSPRVDAELLLALVAWPESAAVQVVESGSAVPVCAIYRRDDLLAAARHVLAHPDSPASLERFLSSGAVERVTRERLGLDDDPHPLFAAHAGRAWREAS